MFGMVIRLLNRTLLVILTSLVFSVSLVESTPQARTAFDTALFVTQVLPTVSIKPQDWFTPAPTRIETAYELTNGEGLADLYLPSGDGEHPAVLLFLGVNPAGRNDPRVVGLAEGLARAGVVVMIPWSDSMKQRRVDVTEVGNLVQAFEHLRNLDEVDSNRMGMGGFCVGASLATVAAQDDRIRDDVRFVNFFGGYYNVIDLIKAVVTQRRYDGDSSKPWMPDNLAVEVVRTQLIESVQDRAERRFLIEVFLEGRQPALGSLDTLSPLAKNVFQLLDSPNLEEADNLFMQLPEEVLQSMRAISPKTNVDRLKARILIMHDREDPLVPSEESERFAHDLGSDADVYYTEFSFFQHVDPTEPVGFWRFVTEAYKLYLHMYNVLITF